MPQGPFLALITPIGDAGGGGGGGQPPYPSQGPGFPTHPIAGPGRPPGWGIANDPGYSPPWATPRPPVDPGYSPPWAQVPGGGSGGGGGGGGPVDPGYSPPWAQVPDGGAGVIPPLGIWGPTDPRPTPPIYIPIMPPATEDNPHPEHPIYLPVYPSHPIYFPPGTKPEEVAKKLVEFVNFWTGNLPTDPDAPETPTPV